MCCNVCAIKKGNLSLLSVALHVENTKILHEDYMDLFVPTVRISFYSYFIMSV